MIFSLNSGIFSEVSVALVVSEVLVVAVVPPSKPGNEPESEGENEPSGNCYRG